MKVKIDTKEKLHVITIHEPELAANMTEQMDKVLTALLDENVKNAVVNMQDIQTLDKAAAGHLIALQRLFNERQASFVVCSPQPAVKKFLHENDLLDQLNVAPTLSEATDIVQMEEIEREMGL
jgi:anti-anti-sigma factor